MSSLTLAVALQVSLIAHSGTSYSAARQVHLETGRPLVVLVGADWCPGCQKMKRQVLPQIDEALLGQVALTIVDTDEQSKLARKLMRGSSIPQLIVYRMTPDGPRRKALVGAQSVQRVEAFLRDAIADTLHTARRPGQDSESAER